MAVAIIATHPHYDLCGEITHWERTEVTRFADVETFAASFTDEEQELRDLYAVVQQYGAYQRYAGQPYFAIWLGHHGGMRATPESSPTADLEWVEPRKDLIS